MTILKNGYAQSYSVFTNSSHDKVCMSKDLYSQYNGNQHSRLYRGIMIAQDAEHPAAFGIYKVT